MEENIRRMGFLPLFPQETNIYILCIFIPMLPKIKCNPEKKNIYQINSNQVYIITLDTEGETNQLTLTTVCIFNKHVYKTMYS